MTLSSWLQNAILNWNYLVIGAGFFSFFTMLYFGCGVAGYIAQKQHPAKLLSKKRLFHRQIPSEIKASLVSILVFATQGLGLVYLVRAGFWQVLWEVSWTYLILETVALFVWNELHFYLSHRSLHYSWGFRKVHYQHHRSRTPTPFSTYAFHPAEAFLLGSVMPMWMFFFPMSIWGMIILPTISIIGNLIGHWNLGWGPLGKPSRHHLDHHQHIHGNFGFLTNTLDHLLKTQVTKDKTI